VGLKSSPRKNSIVSQPGKRDATARKRSEAPYKKEKKMNEMIKKKNKTEKN
jgi:hypothetical protein